MTNLVNLENLNYRYIIGIDLGTTNSAVAYVDLTRDLAGTARRTIQTFAIPQLIAPGESAPRTVLPSFLYVPGAYDLPPGGTALPWALDRAYVVGEFAREQGARVPGRLVTSAKSWLGHAGVDRTAPILPWGAKADVAKVSPVEASRRYLQHMREAWNAQMAGDSEEALFENQLIILTVPASFDEVARELTITAAHQAQIPRAILLEEPLAAFYAWLSDHEADWQAQMHDGQLILVCDVGGGTTDFTLVGIRAGEQGLRFNRLAVGEHLLLGGDNMDLALGRHMETKLLGQPGKLDAQRWHQLVQQCRKAKETLLGDPDPNRAVDITIVGTSGKLIAGTLKGTLNQAEIRQLILDGFFPDLALLETPSNLRRTGLTELGLPYVQDPAITRHLAAFWRRFQALLQTETGRTTPYPDFLLFNGGAVAPETIRHRVQGIVQQWFQPLATASTNGSTGETWAPIELDNPEPQLAVAIGAAYYGLVRLGEGVRIGSGSPRTYYVGVEAGERASVQGFYTGVCLVPRGTEEGFQIQLNEPAFHALTNQPVSFQIYTSSTRLGDQVGDVVQLPPDEVSVLPPIRTVLRYGKKGAAQRLPVQLAVRLTEVGTLELWCDSQQTEHRWKLEFDVRQEIEPVAPTQTVAETVEQALIEAAQTEIQLTFQGGALAKEHPPESLRKRLEAILELAKEEWATPLIRKFADTLLKVPEGRKLSFQHEAYWLSLLGFCLRPGFGDPTDEWRMKEIWKLYLQGLQFPNKAQCRSEWWVFWRRVAGGLKAGHQVQIYDSVRPVLQLQATQKKKAGKNAPKALAPAEELEVWMALANFEWLPTTNKTELGRLLLQKFKKTPPKAQELWALSRLGARAAIYGPLDRLISSTEAATWLQTLFALKLEKNESVAHAVVHLARYTGDRARDVPEEVREQVLQWFAGLPRAERYRDLLLNPESNLQKEEQAWVFGEALPAGLVLAAPA